MTKIPEQAPEEQEQAIVTCEAGRMSAPNPEQRRMLYWNLLTHDEQRDAIIRMVKSGMNPSTIATAAGISVEMVRQVIGDRGRCEECGE